MFHNYCYWPVTISFGSKPQFLLNLKICSSHLIGCHYTLSMIFLFSRLFYERSQYSSPTIHFCHGVLAKEALWKWGPALPTGCTQICFLHRFSSTMCPPCTRGPITLSHLGALVIEMLSLNKWPLQAANVSGRAHQQNEVHDTSSLVSRSLPSKWLLLQVNLHSCLNLPKWNSTSLSKTSYTSCFQEAKTSNAECSITAHCQQIWAWEMPW
jgi:hypothetical protein